MNLSFIDKIAKDRGAKAALNSAEVSRDAKAIAHAKKLLWEEKNRPHHKGKTAKDRETGATTRHAANKAARATANRAAAHGGKKAA